MKDSRREKLLSAVSFLAALLFCILFLWLLFYWLTTAIHKHGQKGKQDSYLVGE